MDKKENLPSWECLRYPKSTALSILPVSDHLVLKQLYKVTVTIIPILQLRKLRNRALGDFPSIHGWSTAQQALTFNSLVQNVFPLLPLTALPKRWGSETHSIFNGTAQEVLANALPSSWRSILKVSLNLDSVLSAKINQDLKPNFFTRVWGRAGEARAEAQASTKETMLVPKSKSWPPFMWKLQPSLQTVMKASSLKSELWALAAAEYENSP